MNITILGGNNHRAEIRELMRLAAEFNKNNSACAEDKKRILFEADNKEVENDKYNEIIIEPTQKPVVKRGKGKVKRW